MSSNADKIKELIARRQIARSGGDTKRTATQFQKGKLTARERIGLLLDEGSFEEYDLFVTNRTPYQYGDNDQYYSDGVVTGRGTINGRIIYVYAQDFTVFGGSLAEGYALKICKILDEAMKVGAPVVALNDSVGARVQEGVRSLAGYADIFQRTIMASGVVPQISAVFGPCTGSAAFTPALTDFVFMTKKTSYMFLSGPKVVEAATGEVLSANDLGGAHMHATRSGMAHFLSGDEEEGILRIRELLSFFPQNNREDPPIAAKTDPADRVSERLNSIIPDNPRKPYNMHEVIRTTVDNGDFLEIQSNYARNIVVGFARYNGRPAGIVANQPNVLAGVLDIQSARKAARFVRFCDAFNIPLVTFVDVPGCMPGTRQEYAGVIIHGSKLLYAYGEATVPKITITLRKSYGGAHDAMGCKQLRGDVNYAWPSAEIAVMGAKGAIEVLEGRKIAKLPDAEKQQYILEKEKEYREKLASPYEAARFGFIDDVIEPRHTRARIIRSLEVLATKRQENPGKKHGNIPL